MYPEKLPYAKFDNNTAPSANTSTAGASVDPWYTSNPTLPASAPNVVAVAAKSNGVVSSPNKPVAITTYSPPSIRSNGNSAITSPSAGAIPTVNDVPNSKTGVADLYVKSSTAKAPSTYTSTVGDALLCTTCTCDVGT